ncbi:MAG: PAS domain-containing sensor histidine kinase [Betaproteobacteria bacterium]|nr:PAS domain-containing sensor histidine kinase [Betaproteobacteria bacterium]
MASVHGATRARRLEEWLLMAQEFQPDTQHQSADQSSQLHGILQSAMDAIITIDEQQRIVLFNAAAERIFGCSAAQAVGHTLDRFIPERFRTAHRAHVGHFRKQGTTTRRMGDETVLYGLRADGEEFPLEASISRVETGRRGLLTVVLRDITARKRAQDALEETHRQMHELYAAMHDVREAERMRIARELHDELAQWLTALKMDVSWLAARLPRAEKQLVDKAEKMKQLVDTMVGAVRRIAADLRPAMLDDLGLTPAIEHLVHEFSQRTGIVVSLDLDSGALEFKDPLVTAIYRMVQEALTNVVRHAQATEARVSVRVAGERLKVAVEDNGKGIDPEALNKEKSYGLRGIRERARTLGGSASIRARAQGGTLIEIEMPVAPYRGAQVRR